jgi:hypothetical protein
MILNELVSAKSMLDKELLNISMSDELISAKWILINRF